MPTSLGAKGPTARLPSRPALRVKAAILLVVLLASAVAGSFVFSYFTTPAPNWTSTTVGSSSGGVSAAVGPAGELFVGYSSGGVKVANLTGGVWRTVYADGYAQRALSTAISVDPSGYFHLAYTFDPADQSAPPSLRAVTNRGGTLTLIAFGTDSILPSIAAGSNGTGHIAFFYGRYSASDSGIGYKTDALGAGIAVRIARTEPWSRYAIRIAVGPSDEVYVGAALDASAGGVGYLTNQSTGWQFHQVENVSVPSGGLAMAIDSSGAIHMAYALPRSPVAPAVRYATNRGGTWSSATILGIGSDTGSGESYLSMVLDRLGHVHLLGIGPRSSGLHNSAIVYSTDAGGSWATSTVTTTRLAEVAGAPISLAITPDGRVHVLYTSGEPGDSFLIDTVNVPGPIPMAAVVERWGITAIWILGAGGTGLLAVWFKTRISRYRAFLHRTRIGAVEKYQELKALGRGPP